MYHHGSGGPSGSHGQCQREVIVDESVHKEYTYMYQTRPTVPCRNKMWEARFRTCNNILWSKDLGACCCCFNKNGQPVFIPNSNVKTIHFNVIYFNYSKIRRLDLNWLTVCVCHKLQLWALCNLILLSDFIFCWIKGPFVFEHTSFSLWFITISFISSDLQLHIFDDIFR